MFIGTPQVAKLSSGVIGIWVDMFLFFFLVNTKAL